jgi:hypothetical protein
MNKTRLITVIVVLIVIVAGIWYYAVNKPSASFVQTIDPAGQASSSGQTVYSCAKLGQAIGAQGLPSQCCGGLVPKGSVGAPGGLGICSNP